MDKKPRKLKKKFVTESKTIATGRTVISVESISEALNEIESRHPDLWLVKTEFILDEDWSYCEDDASSSSPELVVRSTWEKS